MNSSRGPETARSAKLIGAVSTRVALIGLGAVTGVVIARALEPEGRGTYAVIVAVATTAYTVGHLSIEQSNIYLWHRGSDKGTLAANSIVLGAIIGTLAAVLAWAVVTTLGPRAFPGIDDRLFAVALLAVPPSMLTLYLNGLVLLDDRVGRVNYVSLATGALQCGSLIALATAGLLTPGTVVVIWAIAAVIPVFALVPGLGVRPRSLSPSLALRALRTGAGYHIGMASLFLLWRIDLFLLNAQAGRREVGLYAVAVSVAELTYLVTNSVAQVSLPRQVVGSLHEAGEFTARVLRLSAVAGLALVLGIVIASPLVIPLVFGAAFSGSVGPLIALMPGVAALGLIRPSTAVLVRLNRPLVVSTLTVLALVLNVGLNLVLIPQWGAVGAGLASTVAYAALALAFLVWFLRATGLRPADLRPRLSEMIEYLAGIIGQRRRAPRETIAARR